MPDEPDALVCDTQQCEDERERSRQRNEAEHRAWEHEKRLRAVELRADIEARRRRQRLREEPHKP